jgi:hypothetical protein
MIKLPFKTIFLTLLVFTAFTACKKKNDEKSKTELLTKSTWMISKFEEKVNNGAFADDYPNWDPCAKDNKLTFFSNNTATFDEGAIKCDPTAPQTETGPWSFSENETKLTFDGEPYTIEQLDENTLVISGSEVFLGDTYTIRITFRH